MGRPQLDGLAQLRGKVLPLGKMPKNAVQTAAAQRPAKSSAIAMVKRQTRPPLLHSAVSTNRDAVGMAVAHDVCAITNPFCDASKGSKWPDQSAGQTLAVPVRMRYNLTTDAAGRTGAMFTSAYPGGILPGSVNAFGEWNWNIDGLNRDIQGYLPAFTGGLESYRIVSAGVRVTPVTSAMNSQGVINMIEVPPCDDWNDYATVAATLKNFPSYETLPLKSHDSIYGIMRPNGPESRTFVPIQPVADIVPTGTFSTNDWTSILVVVEGGAPASTVAIVDVYVNIELVFSDNNALGYITTRAPHSSPVLTDTSAQLIRGNAIMRGTDDTVDDSFLRRAYAALKGAGSFVKTNGRDILLLGQAAAHAYSGNAMGAGGALMQLGDAPRGRMVD